MSRWFRFYEGALDDPKVQRLPPDVFKGWVNILCLASRGDGKLPSLPDIAFALRISDRDAESLVAVLMDAGLVDDVGDHMEPHKWCDRQFTDATAAERMRRYRARKANERNKTSPLRVTPVTVTSEEEIQNRTEQRKGNARESAPPFPMSGTIEYTPWAKLSRTHAPGMDPDFVAGKVRDFMRRKSIPATDPNLEKMFITMAQRIAKEAA